eukprot:TRINITY_DN9260_c0_g1_i1.p1 TRINITY_DN9260_c0_g1~~TRINITY_DN9260_c0_g1_i1.p1  ORF type:complete len:191 (-),score=7.59 TRINITY_DN9260_c0_g1_i1:22-594(-)
MARSSMTPISLYYIKPTVGTINFRKSIKEHKDELAYNNLTRYKNQLQLNYDKLKYESNKILSIYAIKPHRKAAKHFAPKQIGNRSLLMLNKIKKLKSPYIDLSNKCSRNLNTPSLSANSNNRLNAATNSLKKKLRRVEQKELFRRRLKEILSNLQSTQNLLFESPNSVKDTKSLNMLKEKLSKSFKIESN